MPANYISACGYGLSTPLSTMVTTLIHLNYIFVN